MIRLGLLDPPSSTPYGSLKGGPDPVNSEKNNAIARQVSLESMVLLKNANNFLPLDKQAIKSIAVIGPRANAVALEGYSGLPPYTVSPLDGIKKAVGLSLIHI